MTKKKGYKKWDYRTTISYGKKEQNYLDKHDYWSPSDIFRWAIHMLKIIEHGRGLPVFSHNFKSTKEYMKALESKKKDLDNIRNEYVKQ